MMIVAIVAGGNFARAGAPNMRSFVKLLNSPGHGSIFLKYEYAGEPVLAPASITIRIFCDGENEPRKDITIPACSLDDHEFAADIGELHINYTQGFIQGARVACRIEKQDEFTIAGICRKARK